MSEKHGMQKRKKNNEKVSGKVPKGWKSRQTQIVAQNVAYEEIDSTSQFSKNGKFGKQTHCKFCGKKMYESTLSSHYIEKHPLIMNR